MVKAPAAPPLDASEYFKSPDLSDVTIIIREHGLAAEAMDTDTAGSQQREVQIPGHKVLLSACSSLYKSMLARWCSEDELELPVPAGQLAVGELLIQCIYQPQPQLESSTQQQLVQLLQLGDQFDVGRAVWAASRALSRIPAEQLTWETAKMIYSLPPGCAELEAFEPAYKAAAARVQHDLGDLEATWQQQEKRQLLLALPHGALLSLLQSDETRVASEHTIAYTIQAWADFQQQQQQYPSKEQLQQLVHQIRMPQCSQLYISTVMLEMPAIEPCFSKTEWVRICALGRRSSGECSCGHCFRSPGSEAQECDACGWSSGDVSEISLILSAGFGATPSSWQLPKRQSPLLHNHADEVQVSWLLPVNALADTVDLANRREPDDDEPRLLAWPVMIWAGREIQAVAGAGATCLAGLVLNGPDSGACVVRCEISVDVLPGGVLGEAGGALTVLSRMPLQAGHFRGVDKVFQLESASSGLDAQRQLRRLGMVQDDECLHMRYKLQELIM